MAHTQKRKGYNPETLKCLWRYLFNFLDKLFKDCKVIVNDTDSGYDISKHIIRMKHHTPFTRIELIVSYIKMLILNLVPGTKRVKYKDMYYLMVSYKDIDFMACKVAERVLYDINETFRESWLKYVDKKYEVKPEKKPLKIDMISKEDLSYMYYDKKLTKKQIAAVLKMSTVTLNVLFKKYNLTARQSTYVYISPKKLDDLYYNQDFTVEEIANILDVDYTTIIRKMDEYGIERRKSCYTIPAFMNRMRVFKSQLRKQFRLNPIYAKGAKEVLDHFDRDPDLKPETEKVEKENN